MRGENGAPVLRCCMQELSWGSSLAVAMISAMSWSSQDRARHQRASIADRPIGTEAESEMLERLMELEHGRKIGLDQEQ